MGKASREKGKRGERWLVAQIKAAGLDARRSAMQADDAHEPDVICGGWWLEMKCGKKPNPRAALEQACRDTDGRVPVAVVKDDRKGAFVVMRLADWLLMQTKGVA